MLQKFKITFYAIIVVFIMVHVFIIPAYSDEPPNDDKALSPKDMDRINDALKKEVGIVPPIGKSKEAVEEAEPQCEEGWIEIEVLPGSL